MCVCDVDRVLINRFFCLCHRFCLFFLYIFFFYCFLYGVLQLTNVMEEGRKLVRLGQVPWVEAQGLYALPQRLCTSRPAVVATQIVYNVDVNCLQFGLALCHGVRDILRVLVGK